MTWCQMLLAFPFSFIWFTGLFGQQTLELDGISFSYRVKGDNIIAVLEAETNGWVGIGFNSVNSIVGSDLLLFNIVEGQPSSTDLYVKSMGNPKRDDELGGVNAIQILDSEEHEGKTKIQFSIPLNSKDPYDHVHKIGKEFWLILAYSVADEFEHHSRVRRHIRFTLESQD